MKKLLCILTITLFGSQLYSMEREPKRKCSSTPPSISQLLKTAFEYRTNGDHQKAIDFYKIILKLAQELNDINGQLSALHNLGLTVGPLNPNQNREDLQEAKEYFKQGFGILDTIEDQRHANINNLRRLFYQHTAVCSSMLQEHDDAVVYGEKALTLCTRTTDPQDKARIFEILGKSYRPSDKQKAIHYLKRNIEECKNPSGSVCKTLADMLFAQGALRTSQLEEIVGYYTKALQTGPPLKDKSQIWVQLGLINCRLGDKENGKDFFKYAVKPEVQQVNPNGYRLAQQMLETECRLIKPINGSAYKKRRIGN